MDKQSALSRILIVDDDEIIRQELQGILQAERYEVKVAENPPQSDKIIDKTNIVDKSFATFIHDGQLDYSDNSGHPGKEAHEEWSNYLTSCLREKYEG